MRLRMQPRISNHEAVEMLKKSLRGHKLESIELEAEIVEVPSKHGIWKEYAKTGRKHLRITVVPR